MIYDALKCNGLAPRSNPPLPVEDNRIKGVLNEARFCPRGGLAYTLTSILKTEGFVHGGL